MGQTVKVVYKDAPPEPGGDVATALLATVEPNFFEVLSRCDACMLMRTDTNESLEQAQIGLRDDNWYVGDKGVFCEFHNPERQHQGTRVY